MSIIWVQYKRFKRVNQTTTIFSHAYSSLMRLQASTAGSRSHQFAFCSLLLLFAKAFPNNDQLSHLTEWINKFGKEWFSWLYATAQMETQWFELNACYIPICLHTKAFKCDLLLLYRVIYYHNEISSSDKLYLN